MQKKLPDFLLKTDEYTPSGSGSGFAKKTLRSVASAMSRLKAQSGGDAGLKIPPVLKLLLTVAFIVAVSAAESDIILLFCVTAVQLVLCSLKAQKISEILKPALAGTLIAFLIVLPSMIADSGGAKNNLLLVLRVFVCLECVNIFSLTTKWYSVTSAFKKLHVPGIFIFVLDITLKYIALLGGIICSYLECYTLRSVGRAKKRYGSVGAMMGETFIRSNELCSEMYQAMKCRGFTDEY